MTTAPKMEPCDLVLEARKTWWEIVESDEGECRLMGIVRELADEVERLRATPSAGLREEFAKAAENAKLPEHFQWGKDAMEQFEFGKKCAAQVIRTMVVSKEKS
jgi:hypothetical protein